MKLFCSSDTFNVFLLQTPLMNFYGECLLQITSDSIYLLDVDNPDRCLMVWPLPSLRRYSRDETKFLFESGRSVFRLKIYLINRLNTLPAYKALWDWNFQIKRQKTKQVPKSVFEFLGQFEQLQSVIVFLFSGRVKPGKVFSFSTPYTVKTFIRKCGELVTQSLRPII